MAEIPQRGIGEISRFGNNRFFRFRKPNRSADIIENTADGPMRTGLVVLAEPRPDKRDTRHWLDQVTEPTFRVLVVDLTKPKVKGKSNRIWAETIPARNIDQALARGAEIFNNRNTSEPAVVAEEKVLVGAGSK